MEHQPPYYRIPYLPGIMGTLDKALVDSTEEDWVEHYSFKALPLDVESLIKEDPLLSWLNAIHPFSAGILSMDPWSYYDWHTDERRGVSINMMLGQRGAEPHRKVRRAEIPAAVILSVQQSGQSLSVQL